MANIVITGGLGYIGSELVKTYQNSQHKVDVIDNNFSSSSVRSITKNGINFNYLDVTNKESITPLIQKADIIFHLAGITDVPRTQSEEDNLSDDLIKNVGEIGTKNIIELANQSAKIIFPSTHVVFEGIGREKKFLTEIDEPKPKLIYSKSKYSSEEDLINSNKNFVVLRLGSVHGLSEHNTRLNIMVNLFAKRASQNLPLFLHGKGEQLKSLVSVKDVVNCMRFVSENSNINNEIFHCVSENYTVKEVALICKEFVSDLEIKITDDEVPNDGYGLSSEKLLNAGFEFKHLLKNSIEEMIISWSNKKQPYDFSENEYIIDGKDTFSDDRGDISNYYLENKINHVGLITSKKGAIRGNHYHPEQIQTCLLISGTYLSITKDLNKKNSVIESRLINAGDLSIIYPNIAHTMVFLEDSEFINLVDGERSHENYGETHTFPYELINESLSQIYLQNFKSLCRVCDSKKIKLIHSFGLSPLANNLTQSLEENSTTYPLELFMCCECNNVQLGAVVEPEKLFDNYLYTSSTSMTFQKHFDDLAKELISKYTLTSNSTVLDIGSNDGVFLKPLKNNNIDVVGVEPAKNLSDLANTYDLYTINSYFDNSAVSIIKEKYEKIDLVTAFNVFAHSDHLKEITKNVFELLHKKGSFIIEVQSLSAMVENNLFDNVYHEHVNYWSLTNLVNFFKKLDLFVNDFTKVDTHGGSLRVFVSKNNKISKSVRKEMEYEDKIGLNSRHTFNKFSKRIVEQKNEIYEKVLDLSNSGKKILFYGAPAKATTLLNYYGIDSDMVEFTIEDNKLKHNKFIPNTGIKIINKDEAKNLQPDLIIVLAWNFFESIMEENKSVFPNTTFTTLNKLN